MIGRLDLRNSSISSALAWIYGLIAYSYLRIQVPIGKLYLTTAAHLDSIRNLFTFNTEALESYELGRYDHTCDLPHLPTAATVAANAAAALGGGAAGAAAGGLSTDEGHNIMMELTKVSND